MFIIPDKVYIIKWSDIISNDVTIKYSIDSGTNWISIAVAENHNGPLFGQGYYSWTVPSNIPYGAVLISVYDSDTIDIGFEYTVYAVAEEKHINSMWQLRWSDIISTTVKIEYQIEGGEWVLISANVLNHNGPLFGQGYYNWRLDFENDTNSLIVRVSDTDNTDMYVLFDPVAVTLLTGGNKIKKVHVKVCVGF